MTRYQQMFRKLQIKKQGALVPFVIIGDPNTSTFLNIINTLIQSGADALELGIPFSDAVSDGPSIQKSIQRAFSSGINFKNCLNLIHTIRCKHPKLPIGLLVYANLIFQHGINNFYTYCEKLGIDSVLIPDLPVEESLPFYTASIYHKINHIFICPPNANIDLIKNITKKGSGYIYLLSRPGVTGINISKFDNTILNILVQNIKKHTKTLPILQGFGIHTTSQAKNSILSGTSGIILGSVIADIIELHLMHTDLLIEKLQKFIYSIKISMKQ